MRIGYIPREFFADGETIRVRVTACDRYGYEIDETYSFTMRGYEPVAWPAFSFSQQEDDPNQFSVLPLFWYQAGTEVEEDIVLFWGRGCKLRFDLDDAVLSACLGDHNSQGKEVVEGGFLRVKEEGEGEWTALLAGAKYHLGRFGCDSARRLTFQLCLPEECETEGPVMLELRLEPVRAQVTGTRLSGAELTAGRSDLALALGIDRNRFFLFADVIKPKTWQYFEEHQFCWGG